MSVLDRIGDLAHRLSDRLGREFGDCRTCGKPTRSHRLGWGVQCHVCRESGERVALTDGGSDGRDHDNPVDVADVSDAERAVMLREYLEAFVDEFGQVPRLMPLDGEGKAPIIQGRASLDSPAGREFLVGGEEAVRQIREEGARGFAIYAGKSDHGTEDAVFVDHDDEDTFPTPASEPTLEVLSGSGRGPHESYRNAGDVRNARVADNAGEIRAENWYVVTPGSIHPTGGVYHVVEDRPIATLADDDLDDTMRPASSQRDRGGDPSPVTDRDGEGERPDDDTVDERLQRAFSNSHDGDRIENVFNGRYRAAGFDDRSSAEFWLANRLDSWVALGDRAAVRRLLDRANLQKWPERPDDSYRDSVLSEVGYQDWYYDPSDGGDDDTSEYGHDAEPVVAIPFDKIEALSAGERERFCRKRGIDYPDTAEVRERLKDTIEAAFADAEDALVDAPTSAGKTHTVAAESWADVDEDVTGGAPVVHLHPTRDARDDAAETSADNDVSHRVLRGRDEVCPLAAGRHDPGGEGETVLVVTEPRQDGLSLGDVEADGEPVSSFIDRMCNGKGLSYSRVHNLIEERADCEVLPCNHGTGCLSKTQHDGLPRDDDNNPTVDVVHATNQMAHVPSLMKSTNVVFDERPDFVEDGLSHDRIQRMVTAFLKEVDAPVQTWPAFVQLARYDAEVWDDVAADTTQQREQLYDAIQQMPDDDWFVEDPDAHILAPALAQAIYWAFRHEADENGRRAGRVNYRPPRLDAAASDDPTWNLHDVAVVMDADDRVRTVRYKPSAASPRCVVGLDAHPSPIIWRRNTSRHLDVVEILDPTERQLWRRFERGLVCVQVGDATRPLTSGEYHDGKGMRSILDKLRSEYGDALRTGITSAAVEYDLDAALREVGVDNPGTMHFGEEKSRNDFSDEAVGYVEGCIDPGDEYIVNLLAEAGLDATPATDEHGNRLHGREFAGPDADAAAEILASVREQHVAQSIGRYARDPDDPGDHAVVFVRCDAVHEGLVDGVTPGVTWSATDLQAEINETLDAKEQATAREIRDEVGCSKRHVAQTLADLADEGVVHAEADGGDYGATMFTPIGELNAGAVVDVDVGEIANDHVWGSYTWSFAIHPPTRPDDGGGEAEAADPPPVETPSEPPPPKQMTLFDV